MSNIYLDNSATTSLDKDVLAVMQECNIPSNPSALHRFGQQAKAQLCSSRLTIAKYLKKDHKELIFFSSTTEALNTLIRSMDGHIISSDITHPAVYNTLKDLKKNVSFASGCTGKVAIEEVAALIRPTTKYMIFSAANHETGTKNPLKELAQLAYDNEIALVLDYAAWIGKEPLELYPGVAAIAFSAHKIHGPMGIAGAWIASSFPFQPLHLGGNQEYGMRAGTENVMAICGMAKAVDKLSDLLPGATDAMRYLRDRFEATLKKSLQVEINGQNGRLCNVSNLFFPGIDGHTLLLALDLHNICASQGSACSAGLIDPSRVLIKMGYSEKRAKSSIRFSLSRYTTLEEITEACTKIVAIVDAMQSRAHLYK